MTELAWLPATRLASLIRRRRVGCLELLDHYLARVERFNPSLNAIIATDVPRARRRLGRRTGRWPGASAGGGCTACP